MATCDDRVWGGYRAVTLASDISRANTPPGGYGDPSLPPNKREMPPLFLAECDEPLGSGVADMRGTWKTVSLEINGEPAPEDHRVMEHVERIEQAGLRVTFTSAGVIHDFYACDGTYENAMQDVMALDFTTPAVFSATFDDGVLVFRGEDALAGITIRRWLEGKQLVWEFSTAWTARMERI